MSASPRFCHWISEYIRLCSSFAPRVLLCMCSCPCVSVSKSWSVQHLCFYAFIDLLSCVSIFSSHPLSHICKSSCQRVSVPLLLSPWCLGLRCLPMSSWLPLCPCVMSLYVSLCILTPLLLCLGLQASCSLSLSQIFFSSLIKILFFSLLNFYLNFS